jgi:hypothetical protein
LYTCKKNMVNDPVSRHLRREAWMFNEKSRINSIYIYSTSLLHNNPKS